LAANAGVTSITTTPAAAITPEERSRIRDFLTIILLMNQKVEN
jgi:hypothetical protein